jgi:hypothetical protein
MKMNVEIVKNSIVKSVIVNSLEEVEGIREIVDFVPVDLTEAEVKLAKIDFDKIELVVDILVEDFMQNPIEDRIWFQ